VSIVSDDTWTGLTVNTMLAVWLELRFGLTVDPAAMVALHCCAKDAEGGV